VESPVAGVAIMSADNVTPSVHRCFYDDPHVEHTCKTTPQSLLDDFSDTRYSLLVALHNCAHECVRPVCGYRFHPEDARRLQEACDDAAEVIRPLLRAMRVVPVLQLLPEEVQL
jgi:hypothetical protein